MTDDGNFTFKSFRTIKCGCIVLKALEKSKNISHWGHPCFEEVSLVGFIYLVFNARQVELQEVIQVFVVVSLVCRALLFPFVDITECSSFF